MKIIQILEFIYRWGLQHQLNEKSNPPAMLGRIE